MAYEKQTWVNGQTPLDAEHMTHIEDGIAAAHEALANLPETPEMPEIPAGVTVDATLTQAGAAADAAAVGERLGKIYEVIGDCKTFVTPEMYGAIGDGVTDDTAAIMSAIASGLPVYFKRTTYRVSGFVFDTDVELHGNGCTFLGSGAPYSDTSGNNIISCVTEKNIKLDSIRFELLNHLVNFCAFIGVASAEVVNCEFNGASYVDGEWVGTGTNSAITAKTSKNILIDNCHIKSVLNAGVSCDATDGFVVSNCTFEDIGRGGVYVLKNSHNIAIENNKFRGCVKNFSVSDGAIDMYGAPIYNVRIANNNVQDFGSATTSAIGIRIKGCNNVVCEGNTIISDAHTYAFAGISLQDRYGVANSACVVSHNYVNLDALAEDCATNGYCIRLDDSSIADGVSIANNTLKADASSAIGISVRTGASGLLITGNNIKTTYPAIEFYDTRDFERKNVRIIANKIDGTTSIYGCIGVVVSGNIITSEITTRYPMRVRCTNDCMIDANIIYCNIDFQFEECADVYVSDNNLTVTSDGTMRSKDAGNHLIAQESDTSVMINDMEIVPMVSVYGSTANAKDYYTMDDMSDWTVFNENGDLTLTIGNAVLTDSVPKYAVRTTSEIVANYTDELGQRYVADYRDWGNGVDWHCVRYVELTGTESNIRYYPASGGSPGRFSFNPLSGNDIGMAENSGNGFTRYNTPSCANYYVRQTYVDDQGVSHAQSPLHCNGTVAILYNMESHLRQFADLAEFKAWCAEKYAAGTPLKYCYPLANPYTTPIPSSELAAYKAIVASGEDVIVTTNYDKKITVTTFINDIYYKGIDMMIAKGMKNAITSDGATGGNTTPNGTVAVTINGVTYHLLTAANA